MNFHAGHFEMKFDTWSDKVQNDQTLKSVASSDSQQLCQGHLVALLSERVSRK